VKIVCGRVNTSRVRQGHRHRPGVPRCRRPAGAGFTHPVKRGHTVFAYVIEGSASFGTERESLCGSRDPCPLRRRGRRLPSPRKGTGPLSSRVRQNRSASRGLVGPIVMNTRRGDRIAIRRVPERDLHSSDDLNAPSQPEDERPVSIAAATMRRGGNTTAKYRGRHVLC